MGRLYDHDGGAAATYETGWSSQGSSRFPKDETSRRRGRRREEEEEAKRADMFQCQGPGGGECKFNEEYSHYVKQPMTQLGLWVIEAGPADGDWRSRDSVMILSASANASTYMLGQDVDLTGFALHPNPTDSFYCGSVFDWETKVDVPEVVKQSKDKALVGVRCRPFGGEDDNGQLMWVAGILVARTPDSMCFVCVDLVVHGPVRDDTVSTLTDLGVFDKYADLAAPRKPSPGPSSSLCAAKLDEFDEVRILAQTTKTTSSSSLSGKQRKHPRPPVARHHRDADVAPPIPGNTHHQWQTSPWHHITRQPRADVKSLRERTEAIAIHCAQYGGSGAYHQDDGGDGYDLDFECMASEDFSMDDRSMDDHSMDEVDELQQEILGLDINEQQWATLVQGSRVL